MYTLVYSKWVTNKDLLYSARKSAQYYVATPMEKGHGGEWKHIYIWLSPFTARLKLSQHCLLISYTKTQNKEFNKNRKEAPRAMALSSAVRGPQLLGAS